MPPACSPHGRSGRLTRGSSHRADASKVPPSQFQKPRGSFSATPSSRDGHVDRNVDRDKYFHERHRSMFGVIQESVKETKQKIGTVLHRRGSSSASEKKSKW